MISIHAPARGATCTTHYSTAMSFYFNSRPCERGDQGPLLRRGQILISIHAPARGATWAAVALAQLAPISIHAPARGATDRENNFSTEFKFQFTPLREGRRFLSRSLQLPATFQFTPLREGRPVSHGAVRRVHPISIHAPARGATSPRYSAWQRQLFQFTPLREGRQQN